MSKFGKTDREKLAAYLQLKLGVLTGDNSIKVTYDGKRAAQKRGVVEFPELSNFKVEFDWHTGMNDCIVAKESSTLQVLSTIFTRPEITVEDSTDMVGHYRRCPVEIPAQEYKNAGSGRKSITLQCSDITVAKHLAEKRDSEIFKAAQASIEV